MEKMFETSPNDRDCDTGGDSLRASLLITTSTASAATVTGGRYGQLWRRGISVSILISLRKRSSSDLREASPPSSSPLQPSSPDEGHFQRTPSTQSRVAIDIHDEESSRKTIARIVEEKDLISLREFGGVEQIAFVFGSDLVNGISNKSNLEMGRIMNPVQAFGFWFFFFRAFNSCTIWLLLISSGFCFAIDIIPKGLENGWHDGVAILFAVLLLVTCPSVANFRRQRELAKKKLKARKKMEVKVVREGMPQLGTIADIVEGDILCLTKGQRVPADGLFINGDGLVLDEVLNSVVNADQNPFLSSGSTVIHGDGRMLVTSICPENQLSKVLGLFSYDHDQRSVLETRIEKPIGYADNVALGVALLILIALFLRLVSGKHDDNNGTPDLKGKISVEEITKILERILLKPQGKIGILTTSLAAVVVAVQHGMPFVISVSLSYWSEKVVSDHADLQKLSAFGNLGLVTVVCTDTTGGLRCEEMEIKKLWIGERDVKDGDNFKASQLFDETLSHGIGLSRLMIQKPVSPFDILLESWAKSRGGLSLDLSVQGFEVLHANLCSRKMCSGVLTRKNEDDDNERILHLHWKGDASAILAMCSHYYDCDGKTYPLGNSNSKFEQVIREMEENGLTPIAYAHKQTEEEELREDGLNLLAIIGFKYPCQKDSKSAIEALRDAGVTVMLVSTDEPLVLRVIAGELGLLRAGKNDEIIEGVEFQELSSNQRMKKKLDEIHLMGNFLPKDKLLLVQYLKQKGHVVAFIGGLVANDTLTIKEADVGVTEKTRSTEVAREISDVVLDEGCISSLTLIIKISKCVYCNIQKFIQLQLTASNSGLLITFISTMVTGNSPITAIGLIWLGVIVCILGGLLLILNPQSDKVMTNQSTKRTDSLITKIMWRNIIIQVLYQTVVLLVFEFKGEAVPGITKRVKKAVIFNSLILCQIFNQLTVIQLKKEELNKAIFQKCWFLLAVGAVAGIHFLVVDFVACLVDCIKLNWVQWIVCLLIAALSLVFHSTVNFALNFLTKWPFRSVGSQRYSSSFSFLLVVPFSMFLLFSLSYHFYPDVARTFR